MAGLVRLLTPTTTGKRARASRDLPQDGDERQSALRWVQGPGSRPRSYSNGGRSSPREPLGDDPRGGFAVALQPLIRTGRSVRQHGRLPRRAQPRSELHNRARSGAARPRSRTPEQPTQRRRPDRHRFGAPVAAPQSGGRPPAASRSPGQRDRTSASEAKTHASQPRFRRAPAGGEASPRSGQEAAAALRRHRRVTIRVKRFRIGLAHPSGPCDRARCDSG